MAAAAGGLASALVVGIPTGVVPTPLYTRMTPVQWWNYPVLVATVALTGLAIATYVRPAADNNTRMGGMTGGGLLSAFAIGCPICNKLVVAALGVSGALNIWAPIQPFLGLSGLALIGFALIHRLRGEVSCSVPIPLAPDSVSTRRRSARLDPSSLQGGIRRRSASCRPDESRQRRYGEARGGDA